MAMGMLVSELLTYWLNKLWLTSRRAIVPVVDEYIVRIDATLAAGNRLMMGKLVEETVSVFANSDSNIKIGLDRYKARAMSLSSEPIFDDKGDLEKLRGKLVCLKESQRRDLEANPARLALSAVDENLDECEHLLLSGQEEEVQPFVDRIVQVYGGEIKNISVGLRGYGFESETSTFRDDLLYIRDHLKHYRAKVASGFAKSASRTANIQSNAVNHNSVENVLTITQAAEQVQAIPCNVLDDELKKELELLLLDLDMSKGKSKQDAEGKLGKVLGWLTDKGVDVALAALPYVLNVLQTLV